MYSSHPSAGLGKVDSAFQPPFLVAPLRRRVLQLSASGRRRHALEPLQKQRHLKPHTHAPQAPN